MAVMKKQSFALSEKLSPSLSSMLNHLKKKELPRFASLAAGYASDISTPVAKDDLVDVNLEVSDPDALSEHLSDLRDDETLDNLSGSYFSGRLRLSTVQKLAALESVNRIVTKKQKQLLLDAAPENISLWQPGTTSRTVPETGKGVYIGIVDSGFDLSHPMFRDSQGQLRVAALLEQTQTQGNQTYDTAELSRQWAAGQGPGNDEDGHGTHVASIAGGSVHRGLQGIAPDAQFLLVKTDFINVDRAVAWIFKQAKEAPCVVNLSLGNHYGPHDGTSVEEQLYEGLVGSGKILVVAAGNEREHNLHLGGWFVPKQIEEVTFDIFPDFNRQRPPMAIATFWYEDTDSFEIELISPTRQVFPIPSIGRSDSYAGSNVQIEVSRRRYLPGQAIQVEVKIDFTNFNVRATELNDWRFRIHCTAVTVGRLDAWFANQGLGRFDRHPLVDTARTVGIPATSKASLTVASHVSKNAWHNDDSPQVDDRVIPGRSSPFSSLGPTRDGRWKPDISAPGQYITAALADNSELSQFLERTQVGERLVTIEGTSMATPVMTGAIALMLQKNPQLTPDQIRDLLTQKARRDRHTGPALWNPAYGYGKLDISALIGQIP